MSDKIKEIETELEELTMEQAPDLDQAIEKIIRKKMRKAALKTSIAVVLTAAVVLLGISPLTDLFYPNGVKLSEGNPSQLQSILRAYYETMYPYNEVLGVTAEREGFGSYTLYVNMADHREPITVGSTDVTMKLTRGKLSVSEDSKGLTVFSMGRFSENEVGAAENEEILSEIRLLPETSSLYLSISAKQARDVEDLMEQQSDDLRLEWIQVYQPECSEFQAGIRMHLCGAFDDFDRRQELTAAELKEVYIQNLQTLKEHFDIWKNMGMYTGSTMWIPRTDLLDQLITAAESTDSFKTKNYCISGTKSEILRYLDSIDYIQLEVDKVHYSSFE